MATEVIVHKVHKLRRVYVWEQPVRIYHWLNALAILVLIATGFLSPIPWHYKVRKRLQAFSPWDGCG